MAAAAPRPPISVLARIGNGVLLPVVVFVGWQYLLIASTSGTGSWAGMTIFFASLAVVPGLLVLDLWVLGVRWRGHFRAFFAGLALPAVVGAFETWLLYGPKSQHRSLNSFLETPYAPLAAIALCVPLIVVLVRQLVRCWPSRAGGGAS
jgi:hypothetical protein